MSITLSEPSSQRILVISLSLPSSPETSDAEILSGFTGMCPERQIVLVGLEAGGDVLTSLDGSTGKPLDAPSPLEIPKETILGHQKFSFCILKSLFYDYVNPDFSVDGQLWDCFMHLNFLFSKYINLLIKPTDLVIVLDYPLMLLPRLVLASFPDCPVAYYHRSPFPSSEIFRCIPQRCELLDGLLGVSLLGFQNYSFARHFMSSCTRVLGLESCPSGIDYNGRVMSIGIFPTGIDVQMIQRARTAEGVAKKREALREKIGAKKLIVGYDKGNQLKGVLHKLHIYERYLEMYGDGEGKQPLLVQITPSSLADSDDRKLEKKVWELVAHINGKYGSIEGSPIQYFTQEFGQDDYLALLSEADLALITSERDSTNTMALEYVICQAERKSPLIMSEFVGNCADFSAAILVNPWDYKGVAEQMHAALAMGSREKHSRHKVLYQKASKLSMSQWASDLVAGLAKIYDKGDLVLKTLPLEKQMAQEKYRASSARLILLDYDGTLADIKRTPSEAVPTDLVLSTLSMLLADPKNRIFVISGRDQTTLDSWLGHLDGLGLSAEHGYFLKCPGGSWISLSPDDDLSWKSKVVPIFEYYTERTPGSFIEQKSASVTWHYRLADPEYGSWQAKECQNHLDSGMAPKLNLEVIAGKKNLEVRPLLVNKGEAAKKLIQCYPNIDFVLCIGDDRTDEDMFRALKADCFAHLTSLTCTVGLSTKITQAKYSLQSPSDVLHLLQSLATQ